MRWALTGSFTTLAEAWSLSSELTSNGRAERRLEMSSMSGRLTKTVRMRAIEYSTRVGGVCCRPMALRTMNITTEIFRKAVIVTMINGNSPRAVMKMIRPTVLGASFMADDAHDSYTETLPDLHQRAATQPPAISHDVERLVGRAAQRHQRTRRQALELAERKLDAADFEDEPHRQVVQVRIVQAGRAGELCRIAHAPLPERTTDGCRRIVRLTL